jgi:hypothetical protein
MVAMWLSLHQPSYHISAARAVLAVPDPFSLSEQELSQNLPVYFYLGFITLICATSLLLALKAADKVHIELSI